MPSTAILSLAALDHRIHRGRVFGIRAPDLLRHMYIVGKTGTGKTALLERLLVSVIRAGGGCALLDPGDQDRLHRGRCGREPPSGFR